MVKYFWDIGIQEGDSAQFIDDVRLTNIFALIGFGFAIFKGLTLYFLGLAQPFILISSFSLVFSAVYLSNYFRKVQLSKILVWLIPHIIIFLISSSVGVKGQCHTLLVHLIVVGNVLNYDFSWTKHILMVLTTLFFGFLLYITDFSLFLHDEISSQTYYYIAMNTFFTHLVGGGSIALIIVKRIKHKYEEADIAQAALKQKYDEIIKINEELDKFVYSVSHDLRAPIASSLGLVDIVSKETDLGEIQKYLGLQKMTLEKLDGFIKDILSYSRNSRLSLSLEKIYFEELLADMIPLLLPIGEDIPVLLHFDVKQGNVIYSDKMRLQFVLKNLITNAILYRKNKHPESFVKVLIQTDKQGVKIEIADNGIGIAEKHLPNIFNMFYRGTSATKGSGLGLYIVKEMLSKLKGSIEVKSELGIGTTFLLFIPNLEADVKYLGQVETPPAYPQVESIG